MTFDLAVFERRLIQRSMDCMQFFSM